MENKINPRMTATYRGILTFVFVILLSSSITLVHAQRDLGVRATSSGGPLMPEQAAYDVKSYDLDLRINPDEQSIKGALTVHARIVHPINWFVLDLDPPLTVDSVTLVDLKGTKIEQLKFERREGKLWIALQMTSQPGEEIRVRVAYGGKPRIAPRPPWVGGFVWSKTADGQPWFSTACQTDGADLWFPVKDHPSDEVETASLHFTVPQPLVAASNGKLESIVKNTDGTQTFNWFVASPINNYAIALNVAPYKTVEDTFKSVSGETLPVTLWVLPEDYEKGMGLVKQTKDYLKFYEEYLGPFPFRTEKVGIAQTKHLGMEHQTIIAYGNNFKNNDDGFDWLMLHELGHEWWGNMVTASDWRDMWIHEGFQSFMDTLYVERIKGKDNYLRAMANRMQNLRNKQPVAPRESRTTLEIYMAAPDYLNSDGDIYGKGAVILHTLRYLIGDEPFFKALRMMAYPDPAAEKLTNGRQTRFVNTDDFLRIAEKTSGMDLGWFFEVYLRQAELPKLIEQIDGNKVVLRWEAPNGLHFPMPIDVQVGNSTKRIEMSQGVITVPVAPGQEVSVDPQNWVLKVR